MGLFLFIIGIIGWHAGIYGMFKKVGINPILALVPFYNTWLIVEKCNIKKAWFWFQLVPIAGQFITIWITIIFTMHFKRFSLLDHTLVAFLPFLYFPYIGFNKEDKWHGQKAFEAYKKSPSREWIDAGVFAVVAATIIRTFVFEAYVIPTGSMERTLLINDFLFVSKMSYGPRIPITPISFPFVHNTMPGSITTPSYIKEVQLPYKRLPGFVEVKRNDVVVFNFPAGDTIINLPDFGSKQPYYDVLRVAYNGNREALMAAYPILVHPYDKTDNYIKRCVAVGGDVLQVKKGILYINNQLGYKPANAQTDYLLKLKTPFTTEFLEKDLGIKISISEDRNVRINKENDDYEEDTMNGLNCMLNLTLENYEKVKALPNVVSIEPRLSESTDINMFPNDSINNKWALDNYGPITIPKKGDAIALTPQNIALYRRLITNYEQNTLEEVNGKYIINGKEATTYTPKYNYYWMMGDNRHRSQDSRYWGFVPETHIVGKASLIWFSWNDGPRWGRLFNFIK
ncbi:signal peptidase I [Parasediminibacterium sp. JCM 36343]|uniref:signal peptidase I n=1 Tax=Parasediminibacterium sp. JCM 36343 TaxID=3374279 RepID=UPI00397BF98B